MCGFFVHFVVVSVRVGYVVLGISSLSCGVCGLASFWCRRPLVIVADHRGLWLFR